MPNTIHRICTQNTEVRGGYNTQLLLVTAAVLSNILDTLNIGISNPADAIDIRVSPSILAFTCW
jgi:hypothetical protein